MTGKKLPSSVSKIPFKYMEAATGGEISFDMTILTGFSGMSVDKEGFVRP
jgi:hypothetical protein